MIANMQTANTIFASNKKINQKSNKKTIWPTTALYINEKINNVIFLAFSSFNNFPMHKIIKINTKRGVPKMAIISKKVLQTPYFSPITYNTLSYYLYTIHYFIKNAAYSGIDFMLFSNPKFLEEILIEYFGLYFFI